MNPIINKSIKHSIKLKQDVLESQIFLDMIENTSIALTEAFQQKKQVLFCGNGGSAGDAQHIAAEFSGRFYFNRPPLNAEALHVNSSYLTAVANDYSYDVIYERLIEAKGKSGDVLVGISTSGNSENVLRAMKKAKELSMVTVALTGESGGKIAEYADFLLAVPSNDTPRIQEVHILLGHIICEIVEKELFGHLNK
jgi:D-sedoheptulose 7-phosphate isomerase|tara:strand:+ start:1872 stop:2459 length:588 start_codon:yes stop_codon:yes gene_type:complete